MHLHLRAGTRKLYWQLHPTQREAWRYLLLARRKDVHLLVTPLVK